MFNIEKISMADELRPFSQKHKDGSICARGQVLGGYAEGYWEWYRKDGTLKRSGHFKAGIQVGEWTTYDAKGAVYKVTDLKNGNSKQAPTVLTEALE